MTITGRQKRFLQLEVLSFEIRSLLKSNHAPMALYKLSSLITCSPLRFRILNISYALKI